jgi:hypothetical protein
MTKLKRWFTRKLYTWFIEEKNRQEINEKELAIKHINAGQYSYGGALSGISTINLTTGGLSVNGLSSNAHGEFEEVISSQGMRFFITSANGGTILVIKSQDLTSERWRTSIHVIAEDADIASEIGKIISMELLKR